MRSHVVLMFLCSVLSLGVQVDADEKTAWIAPERGEVMCVLAFLNESGIEDQTEGAYFSLTDSSQWVRTRRHGPVYFLTEGQKVSLIPMSEDEVILHEALWEKEGCLIPYRPFWLTIEPEEGEFRAAVALIAFQTAP